MRHAVMLLSLAALGACSGQPSSEQMAAYDVAELAPAAEQPPSQVGRIAYVYRLGFTLDSDRIPDLQQRHEALCRRLTAARCQVLKVNRTTGDSSGRGEMTLQVDARLARRFTTALEQAAAGAGGRTSDSAIEAEDVTKATIDAEARLRQRTLLVQRLTELLRTRQGSVGDLVSAEKAVADAQEELDAARATLAMLNRRVATSTIDVSYASRSADGAGVFGSPGALLDQSRNELLGSVRALISFAIIAIPWALVLWILIWAFRRWRRHRKRLPEG